jgi:peptidoglycan-associated lipoprotein
MNKGVCFKVVLVCLLSSLILTGCKRPGKKGAQLGTGPDDRVTVDPIGGFDVVDLPGSDAMGPRDSFGNPIEGSNHEFIYFAYDSSQVTSGERYKADSVADVMRSSPGMRLEVEGHCDERGSREYNLTLGESRALAVRQYLIDSGIEADRIQTKSYGEESPAEFGHDEEAYRLNRRAGFQLFE